MDDFVVSTLTCNNRQALFETIKSFVENTEFKTIKWIIFAQGCNSDYIIQLNNLAEKK